MFIILLIITLIWVIGNQILYAWFSRKYWGFNVALYRSIFMPIIMSPLIFIWDFQKLTLDALVIIFFIWIIWASWVIIQFKSYKYLPAGIVASMLNGYNIIVLILWYLVYNETFSILWFFWIILLLSSIIIFSLTKVDFQHLDTNYHKWIFLMLIRIFTYAIWIFWFAYYARELEPLSVAYLSELSVLIWFIPIILFKIYSNNKEKIFCINKKDSIKLFFVTFFPALSSTAVFMAVLYGNIWVVSLTLSTSSIFTALICNFIYKEKIKLLQFIAILISILWLVMIHI